MPCPSDMESFRIDGTDLHQQFGDARLNPDPQHGTAVDLRASGSICRVLAPIFLKTHIDMMTSDMYVDGHFMYIIIYIHT